jgi:hypothetical protein
VLFNPAAVDHSTSSRGREKQNAVSKYPVESIRRSFRAMLHARGTAARAFTELQERGFIECMTKGAFSRQALHATEWRLTW